jgi:hypothetical protein
VSAAAWSQNQRPHKPEIQAFEIINDEQQKEKHAANQFFSSLLAYPQLRLQLLRLAILDL